MCNSGGDADGKIIGHALLPLDPKITPPAVHFIAERTGGMCIHIGIVSRDCVSYCVYCGGALISFRENAV